MSRSPHKSVGLSARSRHLDAAEGSCHRRLRLTLLLIAVLASVLVTASFARHSFAQLDGQSRKVFSRNSESVFDRDSKSGINSTSAMSASQAKDRHPESVPGEIIVRFRQEGIAAKGTSQLESAVMEGRAEIPVDFQRLAGPELIQGLRLARVAPADTERAITALRARPDVLYAEPNYIRHSMKVPNDPRYPEMWGLKNDVHAEPAWDITTGSKNVVVGIVDEGIDINHEDLSDNIWTNPGEVPDNGIDDDANGYVDDVNGWDFAHNDKSVFDYTEPSYPPSDNYSGDVDDHGTHVAGTIGALGNNGKGVVGVNWQVSLMSLKFLTGPEGGGTTADALKAFAYAKAMRELWASSGGARGANIRVLNNSYGGGGFSQAELEAIRALGDAGILFVVAAGNDGRNNDMFPVYPSSYIATNLISVAASASGGFRPNFSNFGPGTVHMTAPGQHILSTTPRNTYNFASGTSMSTPHVAGGAALLCAAFPNISLPKLRSLVLYSGDVASWQGQYIYLIATGRTLNVNNALQAGQGTDVTPPAGVSQPGIAGPTFPIYGVHWVSPGDDGNSGKVAAYQVRFSEADLTDPASFELATPLPGPIPETAVTYQNVDVQVPWRHASGFIGIRAVDEVGNAGPISSVPIPISPGAGDPYTVTESAPNSLSTGGTPLGLVADDAFKSFTLPWGFKFYEGTWGDVQVSTNGALYFGVPPSSGGISDDFESSANLMDGYRVIAGAWDDLRTDRRPGDDVYVVQPDDNRIIFRWQGVTYDSPIGPGLSRGENPVNFEIELQSSGTIIMRYGDGNQKLFPVVGLGGGWPEAYVVASHTSGDGLIDLTNAATVTFALRNPSPPPTARLNLTVTNGPSPVATGQQETYNYRIYNDGPYDAPNTVLTDTLPAGLALVSCTTSMGSCSGIAPGANGTVNVNVGKMNRNAIVNVTLVTQVTAPAGSTISNTASVSSTRFDSDMSDNVAIGTAQVVQVPVFGSVSAITSAYSINFALKQDGSVWGWGQNISGSMGDGSSSLSGQNPTPVPVNNLSSITAISTGGTHSLALQSDGTVWGWGPNNVGQLGGTGFDLNPRVITGLTNVVKVAAGSAHSIALKNDGSVWVWGSNDSGELGIGSADSNSHPVPVAVPGLSGVTSIAAGTHFSVVVRNDGTVWTWGQNLNGQLGVASPNTNSPVMVSGVSGVKAIVAGYNHVLALKTDGTVMGWGMNTFGQTGAANLINVNPTPSPVNGLTDAVAVAAGYGFSLALKSDGTLWGWGSPPRGLPATNTPFMINGISGVSAIAAGTNHCVALLNDGTLRTWGDNTYGQLGDGTTFARFTPVEVTGVLVVSQPILFPGGYASYPPILVRVTSDTAGAAIHYTVNGQEPTQADPTVASGSNIIVNQSLTLKVRAFKSGWTPSAITTATYEALPFWQQVVLSPLQVDQLKAWTVGGRTYVYLMPKFPHAGYRVVDWGQTVQSGNSFSANALVQRYTGTTTQAVATTAQIYDLGPLAPGNYSFDFKNWGTPVKTLSFSVSADPPPSNPIDEQRQFVRQQYLDFLNREPDAPGWDHWTGEITQCTTDPSKRLTGESEAQCIVRKRANTSAAFFLSPEFQNTGYFVLRVYRGSLGRMPYFGGSVPADNTKDEFTRDHAAVSSGIVVNNQLDQTVMYANKQAFVSQFVTRADFLSIYGGLDNEHYVDKLFQTTGVAPTSNERQALINGLTQGNETRASVLFKIVDGRIEDGVLVLQTRYGQLFYNQQLNPGFVQMEYFGYMKRDPDDAGYAFWLAKLNQYVGNFVDAQMVLAFISSPEYRARFGQP